MTVQDYEKRLTELEKILKANKKVGDEFWIEQTQRSLKRVRYLKTLKEIKNKKNVNILEEVENEIKPYIPDDISVELYTKLNEVENRIENRNQNYQELISKVESYAGEVESLRVALTDQLIPNDSIANTLYTITEEIFQTLGSVEIE